MRRILATSLMLSSLAFPAAAFASTPVDDASAPNPIRVSTGVTQPVLLDSASLTVPDGLTINDLPSDAQVLVTLTVDKKGQPQDVRIVKSFNAFWDARIVDAVSQLRFKPGTVSGQPIPVDMNLTINITR